MRRYNVNLIVWQTFDRPTLNLTTKNTSKKIGKGEGKHEVIRFVEQLTRDL